MFGSDFGVRDLQKECSVAIASRVTYVLGFKGWVIWLQVYIVEA